jgi:hypothetical protein
MKSLIQDVQHPDHAELVRLLDGEIAPDQRTILNNHITTCFICSRRRDEIEEVSSWFHEAAAELDGAVEIDDLARGRALANVRAAAGAARQRGGRRGTRVTLIRVAAAVALVVAGTLIAPPVSAWIAARLSWPTDGMEAPERVAVTLDALHSAGPTVSFAVVGPTFRIELAHPQTSGAITIEPAEGPRAAAQILNRIDESLLVLPTGIHVENSMRSVASYRVELPAGVVTRVEVWTGGEVGGRWDLDPGDANRVIELAPARGMQ